MPADTFSATLGVLLMGTGNDNNSWGGNANSSVFQIFEDAIANVLTSSVTGGTLDLSGSAPPAGPSQVRYSALVFTGTLASNQTIKVPNLTKFWWVNNETSGAFTLAIETPSGSPVTIPQNSGWQLVLCDGANDIVVSPFNSQQIQMPDGSAGAPAYSDVNEPTSGWYRHATQDWRLSLGGIDVLQVTGAGAASPNQFNVLSPLSNSIIPTGAELAYAGVTLPSGFLWEFGQTVSRTTYANLLTALRASFSATFSSGSPTVNVSSDLRNLGLEGATVESATPGITGLTISAVNSNSLVLSGNASASSGGVVTCFAYPFGNGDGSTTFGIPDRRGRTLAGRDNMNTTSGAAAAGRLTSGGSGIPGIQLGAAGGAETQTIGQTNLPSVNFANSGITLSDPGHLHVGQALTSGHVGATGGSNVGNANTNTGSSTTGITISAQGSAASGGSGTALSDTQPTGITNYIIKT
jgi:hypothetical protein